MDLTEEQLLEIAFDAADSPAELTLGWEQTVLEHIRSEHRRARHRAWDEDGTAMLALDAFITTASELGELLDSLDPAAWEQVTRVEGVGVRDIVTHLVGVERYVLGQLGHRPVLHAPRREDHWPVTRSAAADLTGQPTSEIAQIWWRRVLELIATCGELGPDFGVAYHHLGGDVSGFLVVRTFELWTHGDDIRQAIQRPLDLLDDRRLSLMVGELMGNLPLGLALAGTAQPGRTASFRLEGLGGGSFDVALAPGEAPGSSDITITTSTIELCRVAANRLDPVDLDGVVEGDGHLFAPVMAGIGAFAAD